MKRSFQFLSVVILCLFFFQSCDNEELIGENHEKTSALNENATIDELQAKRTGEDTSNAGTLCGGEYKGCSDCFLRFTTPVPFNQNYTLDEVFIVKESFGDFNGNGVPGVCTDFQQSFYNVGFGGPHLPGEWYPFQNKLKVTECDPLEFYYDFFIEAYFKDANGVVGFAPFTMDIYVECGGSPTTPYCNNQFSEKLTIDNVFYTTFPCIPTTQDFVPIFNVPCGTTNVAAGFLRWFLDPCCDPNKESCDW